MPSRRAPALLVTALALGLAAVPAAAQSPPPPGTPPPPAAPPSAAPPPPAPAPPATPPPPAPPEPPAPPPTIRAGVTAGGVDLSGLTRAQATRRLRAALRPRLRTPFVLDAAGRRWVLRPRASKLTFDGRRTGRRALHVKAGAKVRVALHHSRAAVRAFVARVARRVDRAPRDATVAIALRHVRLHDSRPGRALPARRVAHAINAALSGPSGGRRELRRRLQKVRPRLTSHGARRLYRTVITIDKAHFRLRLFKRMKVVKTYGVAVGMPAFPTPSGLFRIADKQVDPTWSVPNSPWAGELAGTTVAGGSAANPLKARWMGIVDGVGIHGTGEDWSIGHRASHGCIRMHVADVKQLYRRVPVGTPVLIA